MSPALQPSSSWHIAPEHISAYLNDRVDVAMAASIESHVLACGSCQAGLGAQSDAAIAVESWATIERRVDAELAGPIERLAVLVGFNERDARTLAPTRALQLSWLLAMTAALVCAAWLARQSGNVGANLARLVFLTVAPLVPLVAVVTALSTASEPAPDIARATAASRLRIGAIRALTVMLGSIGIGLAVSVLLPGEWIRGVVWLCPALALSALGSLVAAKIRPENVVGILGGSWVSVVAVAAYATGDRLAAFGSAPQLGYLAIATAAAIAITFRPASLDLRRLP